MSNKPNSKLIAYDNNILKNHSHTYVSCGYSVGTLPKVIVAVLVTQSCPILQSHGM